MDRNACNALRYDDRSERGHFESYFLRANHPERPLAFWVRYTLFIPRGRPDLGRGQLWGIYFDGEALRVAAAWNEFPIAKCQLSRTELKHVIGGATLDGARANGSVSSAEHSIEWSLEYGSPDRPLLLYSEWLYRGRFPKQKALVPSPRADFHGALTVDGVRVPIDRWVGSQSHNWGSGHTDAYAWGQVAGFEGEPEAFLECASARYRVGGLWTPWLTVAVLRLHGEQYALNSVVRAARATSGVGPLRWWFDTGSGRARMRGSFSAPRERWVALPYANPPGGTKTCLNTKLAACSLTLERVGRTTVSLQTDHRAAFEILTDGETFGVPVVAAAPLQSR